MLNELANWTICDTFKGTEFRENNPEPYKLVQDRPETTRTFAWLAIKNVFHVDELTRNDLVFYNI
jgi:hypothetical protein